MMMGLQILIKMTVTTGSTNHAVRAGPFFSMTAAIFATAFGVWPSPTPQCPAAYPLITVNTGSMLQHYLHVPGRWAVAPLSVIRAIKNTENIGWYKIQDGPAPRICYKIRNRYPHAGRLDSIACFEQELKEYISREESICTYEEWMRDTDNWKRNS